MRTIASEDSNRLYASSDAGHNTATQRSLPDPKEPQHHETSHPSWRISRA